MAFPVFHEFDADGTIRTNGLHWEGFPRLAWEALSAAGYTTPPTYEVSEFERLGVLRCRVIITLLPHPDHARLVRLEFCLLGFYYPRDRRVSRSPSVDGLLEDHVWFEDQWMVASLCDE
jgi:hypothetical protein